MKIVTAIFGIVFLTCCGQRPGHDSADSEIKALSVDTPIIESTQKTSVLNSAKVEYTYGDEFKLDNYLVYVHIDTNDLQTIEKTVALLAYPTDTQIEEMKKKYGEDDFYTIADDANFYQGTAIGLIDSLGIATVTAEKRFIEFRDDNTKSSWTLDIRNKHASPWSIIFFKKGKKPQIVSTIDWDYEEMKNYFAH